MNGAARIAGAAGFAGVLSLTTPPAPTATTDVVQPSAPSGSTSSISVPSFTSSTWAGSGLLPGLGYSSSGGSTAVVDQTTQSTTLASGSPIDASGSTSSGTVSEQPVGDLSVLSFNVANGSGVVSQSGEVSGGGTATSGPQTLTVSFNSGATTTQSFAVPTQTDSSGQIGATATPSSSPEPIGTTTSITSSVSNQGFDLGFNNLQVTSPNDVIAPAGVRILSPVNTVPEPAMLTVLGVGLIGLGAVRRRKAA